MEAFDPLATSFDQRGSWYALAELPKPCLDHRQCAVPGGLLVCAVGGEAFLYDAAGDRWVFLAKGEARRYHPLVRQRYKSAAGITYIHR